MSKDNIILAKSYAFAVGMVKCYQYLIKQKNCYDIVRQLLKSGTSIGG